MPDIDLSAVVSALNKKADVGLENSPKASDIESIANSAASAANSANEVANAASTLINTTVQEINKDLEDTKTEINTTLTTTIEEINTTVDTKLANTVDINSDQTITGTKIFETEVCAKLSSEYPSQFRMVTDTYGSMWRNDGSNTYLLLTNVNDPYGRWNDLRPISVNNSTGKVSLNLSGPIATSSYNNGNWWYRLYNDGYIEQGGFFSGVKDSASISFPVAFATTNYYINWACVHNDSETYKRVITAKATTYCSIIDYMIKSGNVFWYTCGW